MAEILGINKNTLSAIELGHRDPKQEVIERLATVMKVSLATVQKQLEEPSHLAEPGLEAPFKGIPNFGAINIRLLTAALKVTDELIERRGLKPSLDKKAAFIAAFYMMLSINWPKVENDDQQLRMAEQLEALLT